MTMKLAMVFPGQGSQSVGMLAGFGAYPVVSETLAEAGAVLGQDLWTIVADGPAGELNRTVNTQPIMLAADIAIYRAWQSAGGSRPAMLAGHSLGEYAALVAAGVLSFTDALPLVRFRAQAMQDAVPQGVGAMAAIMGLDDAGVADACAQARQGQAVDPVNFNAPGQTVIAGNREAVERAMAAARAKGAKRALMLPVSAPFHSSLLKPAADRLVSYLAKVTVREATIPVIHNVNVESANSADEIRDALAKQAANPVRWVETVRAFATTGVTHVVECGPGTVLSGLCRRIAPEIEAFSTNDGEAFAAALDATKVRNG